MLKVFRLTGRGTVTTSLKFDAFLSPVVCALSFPCFPTCTSVNVTTSDNQLVVIASSNFSYLTSATPTVLSYSIGGSFGQPLQVFGNLVSARSLR